MSSASSNGGRSLLRRILDIEGEIQGGKIAASYFDYESETAWSFRGDTWFHAASTIKVAVLLGLFAAAAEGRFSLSSSLHVRNRFFSVVYERDSGSAVYAALGRTMKLRDLAHHMIVTSNNLATNLLVDLIGVEHIGRTLAGLGVKGVELLRGV